MRNRPYTGRSRRSRVKSKSYDKRNFSRTADMSHYLNNRATPMRGGIRL